MIRRLCHRHRTRESKTRILKNGGAKLLSYRWKLFTALLPPPASTTYIPSFPLLLLPPADIADRRHGVYRFVPLLANLYPLITLSRVYNTRDCNLDNIVCVAFVARLRERRIGREA